MDIQKQIALAKKHLAFLREVEEAEKHIDYMLSLSKEQIREFRDESPSLFANLMAKLKEVEEVQKEPGKLFNIEAYGKLDSKGKIDVNAGIILACGNRQIAINIKKEKAIDEGYFLDSLSTMGIEESCLELWQEYFGDK